MERYFDTRQYPILFTCWYLHRLSVPYSGLSAVAVPVSFDACVGSNLFCGYSFRLGSLPFVMCPPHSWNTSLLSDTTRCSRFISCFPCPGPEVHHLSREPWVSFMKNGTSEQDLGFRCFHSHWGVSTPSKERTRLHLHLLLSVIPY